MRKYQYSKLWKSLTFTYLIVIAYFSLRSPSPEMASIAISDKLLHIFSYLWAGLFFGLITKKKYLSLSFIFICLYGFSIELIQEQLGNRYYELEDQWANMAGAFGGSLLCLFDRFNLFQQLENYCGKSCSE
ncbi:MAG: VanZ family protein [Bacteriovoracaceae bacterium]